MLRGVLFAAGTAGLAWVSWPSLRSRSSHGFYRFFAWEAILALLLVNFRGIGAWFADPLAVRQIISWVLLFGSVLVLVTGVRALRVHGRPQPEARSEPLLGIEKTTALVTTGVYRFIRHPMYASLLYLAWGVFLKRPGWLAASLALTATVFLHGTARAEEREDVGYFGDRYVSYMAGTRMFVPFLY
jgi:protein-S-isoprenylcysteine O-methyltransferase Ste14